MKPVMASGQQALALAMVDALKAAPALAALNRIGIGTAERAPFPHAWIEELNSLPWGTKTAPGEELRATLSIADRGDAARLHALTHAAVTALLTHLPRPLGGFDHAGAQIIRQRSRQQRDGTRLCSIDLRLRVLRIAAA